MQTRFCWSCPHYIQGWADLPYFNHKTVQLVQSRHYLTQKSSWNADCSLRDQEISRIAQNRHYATLI